MTSLINKHSIIIKIFSNRISSLYKTNIQVITIPSKYTYKTILDKFRIFKTTKIINIYRTMIHLILTQILLNLKFNSNLNNYNINNRWITREK